MNATKNRVVIVVTSHSDLGETGQKTGYHLEELAVPYLEFKKAGAEIVIASPQGGKPPVDPKSAKKDSPEIQEFRDDPEATRLMNNTVKLGDVEGSIDLLFFPGGHGPMWDLANSSEATELIEEVWRDGGIIAALCHGPAALLNAKDANGQPLVRGKKINSFTDEEEKAGGLYDAVPFHLEARLRELGAKFENSPKQQAHVVRDGRLITGQNPASAKGLAQAALQALDSIDTRAASELRESGSEWGDRLTQTRRSTDREEMGTTAQDAIYDDGRLSTRPRVSNEDGERATNGRVIEAKGDDHEISSRYVGEERISDRDSDSGHSLGKSTEERNLPSPDLDEGRIQTREMNSGRGQQAPMDTPRTSSMGASGRVYSDAMMRDDSTGIGGKARTAIPEESDDRMPSGMTSSSRNGPNIRRDERIGQREDRSMDANNADHGEVLHDDLPREKRAQASRTKKQESDHAQAASLNHKKAQKTDKPSRNPRR